VSVGEEREHMRSASRPRARTCRRRPRYLMGVGTPEDFFDADRARHRPVRLRDAHAPRAQPQRVHEPGPRQPAQHRVGAATARRSIPTATAWPARATRKAVLRHLCTSEEMLGPMLLTLHNLRFFHRLLARIRAAIEAATPGPRCAPSACRP
jgi:queuine tRNA-ribosyltransferase